MARKDDGPVAPVVTSLPLPSSDSVLVIDLPDGQKLLVGKMSHGTVIEVATWRGTGRPDSRTNRLMLGMSSSDSEPTVNASSAEEELEVDKRSIKYWIWLAFQISRKIKANGSEALKKGKNFIGKKNSQSEAVAASVAIEDDVQAWLENIKSKSTDKAVTKPLPSTLSRPAKSPSKPQKAQKKVVKKANSSKKA